jgi:single-strand DNA-binding protein
MSTVKNRVSLIGRLGKDPELTELQSGRCFAKFSLATNESYKDKSGEWQDNTQWHDITIWGPNAQRVKKVLNKGQEIVLEGRIVYRSYETKDGEKRQATVIEGSEFWIPSSQKAVSA